MSKYLIDRIRSTSNIKVETCSEVVEALGNGRLQGLKLRCAGQEREVPTTGLFIFIGAAPETGWLPEQIMRDPRGFVLSGPDLRVDGKLPRRWKEDRDPYLLESSMAGIFVAGDVRHGSVKRVASAVGEGSIAVQFMHQYLARF